MQLRLKYQRPEHGLRLYYIHMYLCDVGVCVCWVCVFGCADKLLVDGYSDAIVMLIIDSLIIAMLLICSSSNLIIVIVIIIGLKSFGSRA